MRSENYPSLNMNSMELKKSLTHFLGIESVHVGHLEKWVSALGAGLAIAVLALSLAWLWDDTVKVLLLASMGASAVLLFAIPHGPLSQPWSLFGGHLISAFIGISCAQFGLSFWLAGALAVGLSVLAMYYLRCIHPPGGATALAAVLSTPTLGYGFLLMPVLLNVTLLLIFALVINNLLLSRHYPSGLRKPAKNEVNSLVHDDIAYALKQMNSFIDIDEDDLVHLYMLTNRHARSREAVQPLSLRLGKCYSNGRYGPQWSVRRIEYLDTAKHELQYRTLVGHGRRQQSVCSLQAFQAWASHEVERDEENWKRVEPESEKLDSLS